MKKWKKFEIDCTNYLNNMFGTYATFIHQGGADSTVSDIFVKTKSGKTFYIDAKQCPAQCGQFVLLPDIETKTFQYSTKNVNPINSHAEKIIYYMKQHYQKFCEASTTGREIVFPNSSAVFSNWIIQIYQEKRTRFFITNDFAILPIEQFQQYFDVTAKYRIKRSGSSHVGKRQFKPVMDYISSHDYGICDCHMDGDKLFVLSLQNLHNQRFILQGNEYMFSLRNDTYELRRLSNTYHANVIFSIKQRENILGMGNSEFISTLK